MGSFPSPSGLEVGGIPDGPVCIDPVLEFLGRVFGTKVHRSRQRRVSGTGVLGRDRASRRAILDFMRTFSLLFAAIALVMLVMFLIYVVRGPVDPVIAGGLFVSFLACLVPALLLLKPFEPPEELRRRREARREREKRRRSTGGPRRGSGS
jgi:hypothetical protein